MASHLGQNASNPGRRSGWIVGVGMVPRGDVGIIVASLGRQAGVIGNETYTLVIVMVLLTSVIAPPLLALLLARQRRTGGGPAEREPRMGDETQGDHLVHSESEAGH